MSPIKRHTAVETLSVVRPEAASHTIRGNTIMMQAISNTPFQCTAPSVRKGTENSAKSTAAENQKMPRTRTGRNDRASSNPMLMGKSILFQSSLGVKRASSYICRKVVIQFAVGLYTKEPSVKKT